MRFRSEDDASRMELWPAAPFTASVVETEAASNAVMPADELSQRTLSARGRSRIFQVSRGSKSNAMAYRYVIVLSRRSW